MNFTTEKCIDCKEEFLMSFSEKMQFAFGWCPKCLDPKVRHIRAKIVMGYYDIGSITAEVANKLVDSELEKLERRRSPRINVIKGDLK